MPPTHHSWRLDTAGRLYGKYRDDRDLMACWTAALSAGIPLEDCQPGGSMVPMVPVPDDSLFSEVILRAFEAVYGRAGTPQDPYPPLGFKANLRDCAYWLDTAAKLLVEYYKVEPTEVLVPVGWLHFRGLLSMIRAEAGGPNPYKAMEREILGSGNYPYLRHLWTPAFNDDAKEYEEF